MEKTFFLKAEFYFWVWTLEHHESFMLRLNRDINWDFEQSNESASRVSKDNEKQSHSDLSDK